MHVSDNSTFQSKQTVKNVSINISVLSVSEMTACERGACITHSIHCELRVCGTLHRMMYCVCM